MAGQGVEGEAKLSYDNGSILLYGINGITPSGNHLLTDVAISHSWGVGGSAGVTDVLGTGSVVFVGSTEAAKVVLWGEVIRKPIRSEETTDTGEKTVTVTLSG